MTDTSNADSSPDSQDDGTITLPQFDVKAPPSQTPPPSSWTPPRGAPSPLSALAGYAGDSGVWNRADPKTPDQPTTVAGATGQPAPPSRPSGQPPAQKPMAIPPPPIQGLGPRHPFPFRPKPIQRYFPPLPNRPWSEWGQPRPFAPQPQPWEANGIFADVARYFGQQGPGNMQENAALLGAATQGHSKAYMEGQSDALRILKERRDLNAQALADKHDQLIADYRDAFALAGGDVASWTGKDVQAIHDRVFAVANKAHDVPLLTALASGNMTLVENILKERDVQGTKLRESLSAQRKEEAQNEADAPFLQQPRDAAGAPTTAPTASPTDLAAAPSKTAPEAAPAAAQPAARQAPPQSPTLAQAQARGFRPDAVNDAANDALTGDTKATDYKDNRRDLWPLIEQRKREIQDQARGLANDPNLKQGPDTLDAVQKLSPKLGADVDSLVNGDMPISARANNEYQRLLISLARKVNPGWSPQSYDNIKEFQNPNGRTQLKITRSATMAQSGKQVLDDLKAIPDSATAIDAALKKIAAGAEGTPEYRKLYADWLTYNIDANALKTGGTGSVTETGMAVETVPQYFGTKEQYRAVVQSDMGVAKASMDESRVQWRAMGVTRPMFGEDPAVTQTINRIAAGDPAILGGPAAQPPVQVSTPDDVGKLRPGTPFIIPNGPHKGETGYAQ